MRPTRITAIAAAFTLVAALGANGEAIGAVGLGASAKSIVLTVDDFPAGASVAAETTRKSRFLPAVPYTTTYTRTFGAVSYGKSRFLDLFSSALVARSTSAAEEAVSEIALAVRSPRDRSELASELRESVGAGATSITFLRHRVLHVGDQSVDFAFAMNVRGEQVVVGELFVQDGPFINCIATISLDSGLTAGTAFALAKTLETHIKASASPPPANKILPVISGLPSLGEILTALPGTWTGAALTYGFQWLRCNASGSACVPISGATASNYTVSTADEGSTLEASITAASAVGHATAASRPSILIP